MDWNSEETVREATWQRQLHLFGVPFYYIEYGIAQLGALQVWLNSLEQEQVAINQYMDALYLGGKEGLPVLFQTAGTKFDFGSQTIGPLFERIESELKELPA